MHKKGIPELVKKTKGKGLRLNAGEDEVEKDSTNTPA